jgi:hypothetical protein
MIEVVERVFFFSVNKFRADSSEFAKCEPAEFLYIYFRVIIIIQLPIFLAVIIFLIVNLNENVRAISFSQVFNTHGGQ